MWKRQLNIDLELRDKDWTGDTLAYICIQVVNEIVVWMRIPKKRI